MTGASYSRQYNRRYVVATFEPYGLAYTAAEDGKDGWPLASAGEHIKSLEPALWGDVAEPIVDIWDPACGRFWHRNPAVRVLSEQSRA